MNKRPPAERIEIGPRLTIYRRGKQGTYVADFHFEGHCTQSLKTTNETIAKRKSQLIDAQLQNETFSLPTRNASTTPSHQVTLKEAIDDFLEFHRTEGNRHRTVRRYQGILQTFCEFAATKKLRLLVDVNLLLIDAYRAKRAGELSPRSMHNEGRLLKCFLGWCEEREYISRNPLYKRKFRRPKPKARKAPSLSDVNSILANASKVRMATFAFLAFTGARSGECRNLRVEDVDFAGGWIYIRSRPGHETKNGDDRKVPMHPRLRTILEEVPKARKGWFFRALPSNRYPHGEHHVNTKRLNEDFQKVLTRLGLPTGRDDGFTLHSLRRFFRTYCVNANIPERVVDLWVGHRDTSSMGTIYYDLSDERSQAFMQQVPFGEDAQSGLTPCDDQRSL